mmetsp:Transcript_45744/g.145775  ORF Transcript_45744/g.145775 Transcript_45744/m.145775 type:complete len:202 (+) Transcript_45744:1071-1676(+)
MYSLMSRRTMLSSEPKMCRARVLVSSVLPTPVGPEKSMLAMGLSGSLSPHRARFIACEIELTASVCPMTLSARVSPRWRRRSWSSADICSTGTPDHNEATRSMSATVTVTRVPSSSEYCCLSSTSRSLSRAASSKSPSLAASTLASWTDMSSWKSCSASCTSTSSPASRSFLRAPSCTMRAREPASSMMSIALSGRKRSAT